MSTINWLKYYANVLLAVNLGNQGCGEPHMTYVFGLLHKLSLLQETEVTKTVILTINRKIDTSTRCEILEKVCALTWVYVV